jgi:hypothetical protein
MLKDTPFAAPLSTVLTAGLLKVGVPKTWGDSKKDLRYIRKAGVQQFISTYNRVKDLKGDELLWGDEIEYGVFKLDAESKKVRLCLRAKEVSSAYCWHSQSPHSLRFVWELTLLFCCLEDYGRTEP